MGGRSSAQNRREPVQARGRRTVERIVEAAAQEFAASGYDAATTTAIAHRAGVAVGSIYQFFSDKEDLLAALADRYAAGTEAILADATRVPAGTPLAGIVDSVVEAVVRFARDQPFLAVLLTGTGSAPVRRASECLRGQLAGHVETVIAHKRISRERRRRVAAAAVDILGALLPRALAGDARSRRAIVDELKLALASYLGAVGGAQPAHSVS